MAQFVTERERERERESERKCVRVIANLSPGYNQDVGFNSEQFWGIASGFPVYSSKPLFFTQRAVFHQKACMES